MARSQQSWRYPFCFPLIVANQSRPGGSLARGLSFPQTKPSHEGVGVVAGPATAGQLLQLLDVSSPEHDIVGLEGRDQAGHHIRDVAPPLLLAPLLQATQPDVILVSALLVGQMAELHRLHDPVDEERGAEPGAEPEKEHLPALVAPP